MAKTTDKFGVYFGECKTTYIKDYSPEEQEKMMNLKDVSIYSKKKRHFIGSNYGDRLKQARRNGQ